MLCISRQNALKGFNGRDLVEFFIDNSFNKACCPLSTVKIIGALSVAV